MTTFKELKRLVFIDLGDHAVSGKADLVVNQAINDAQKVIARVKDFEELVTLDTTHAATVISQKSYHIATDLGLIRPKDILSIRYMDEADSRKLDYVNLRELDKVLPYTDILGTGKPTHYTRRGMYIELLRIPDAAKPLYIQHSQWPDLLANDEDETPYINIDDVIVELAADMALAKILGEGGSASGWAQRASQLLGLAVKEEITQPDKTFVAQPFSAVSSQPVGEYWKNPFVKE